MDLSIDLTLSSILKYCTLSLLVLFCYLLAKAHFYQKSTIEFYEKQGIKVFPGSKRFLIGSIIEQLAYTKKRMSSDTVPVDLTWMLQNADTFEGNNKAVAVADSDKHRTQPYTPMTVLNILGQIFIVIGDLKVIEDIVKDRTLVNKNSFLKRYFFDKRLGDNVQSNPSSKDLTKRRRAFMSMFSGTTNFKIMDDIFKKNITDHFDRIKRDLTSKAYVELDLRDLIRQLFESITTAFIFGHDNSELHLKFLNIDLDGTIEEKSLPWITANEGCINSGASAKGHRMIFGERRLTNILDASLTNWERICSFVDQLVEQRIDKSKKEGDDNLKNPKCLLDLMRASEVYGDDVPKIANDVIMAIIGGTDTGRNSVLISLCHLIKNASSRERVRNEINQCLKKNNVSDVIDLTHKHIGGIAAGTSSTADFGFLNQVIHESLRFNTPLKQSDEYRTTRECTLGGYTIQQDTGLIFDLQGAHNNPDQWQQPFRFLPERFDPEHKLFKTPKGDPRNPMSFIPFSFGERKCLGYQFAGQVIPAMVLKLIHMFDFEFIDTEFNKDDVFPMATVFQNNYPPVMVKVSLKSSE